MLTVSPEVAPITDPFVIRAHHIQNLYQMLHFGIDPEQYSTKLITGIRQDNPGPGRGHGYAVDVFGLDENAVSRFHGATVAFAKDFQALPADYPIKLVVDQKDAICNACAIGDHCSLKPGLMRSRLDGDQGYLRAFQRTAKRLGLEDQYEISQETAEYSNGKPRIVPALHTTADVARKVFAHPTYRMSVNEDRLARSLCNLVDQAVPGAFFRDNPGIRNKLRPLRPLVGAYMAAMALSVIFHVGQGYQLYEQGQAAGDDTQRKEINAELVDVAKEAHEEIMLTAGSGVVYLCIPRRRIVRRRSIPVTSQV